MDWNICQRSLMFFCKSRGIKRHRTVPLNPQQNGVAERANRTILERSRCILLAAGLGKRFWAEAASTAVTLMNKCPSSSLNGDLPENRWFGRNGSYENLRVFGCKAFAHIKQGKLEARAVKCIMMGYQPGVKGYRLWCIEPGKGKIIISRDVIFWEHEMPFMKKADTETKIDSEKVIISELEVEHQETQTEEETENADVPQSPQSPQPVSSEQSSPAAQGSWRLARDRAKRNVRPSSKYSDAEYLFYCLMVAEEIEYSEPNNYEEAVESKDWEKWMQAMIDEIDSLLKNGTWVLVERPNGRR